jgi:hypothetical protein
MQLACLNVLEDLFAETKVLVYLGFPRTQSPSRVHVIHKLRKFYKALSVITRAIRPDK